jgi:enterochelin esterase-like enzyme
MRGRAGASACPRTVGLPVCHTAVLPTRRQVLAGLAGVVVAGATGAGIELDTAQRERILHHLGLAGRPDRAVRPSGTPLASGRLSSRHMPSPVSWTISMPTQPTGVVYCLHGRGNDHRYAFDAIHLHDFVAAGGARLAVAAVDGNPYSYWHRRADGRDPMSMLLEEFIPMVDQRVGTAERALLGWSMGGYGALLAAETAPERFRAVAAASPALWSSPGETAPGAFDGRLLG